MPRLTTHALTLEVQKAGYQVVAAEQLRPNRWLMQLLDGDNLPALLIIQARPLVGAADVQDLAEFVSLRRPRYGILLAYGGTFSAVAQRTLSELADHRLRLCTTLPPTGQAALGDARVVVSSVKPTI